MYCDICLFAFKTLPEEFLTSKSHHASFQSLRDSAQVGCPSCTELLENLPYKDIPGLSNELAPCTLYEKTVGNPVGLFKLVFSSEWLARCIPEHSSWSEIRVIYASVPVEAKELPEDWIVRAGSEFDAVCCDQESVKRLWGENTGSRQSWSLIQDWVTKCETHHRTCKGPIDAHWLPTRLIHIGNESDDLRLSVPESEAWPPDDRYTTLSHCWGPDSTQVAKLEKLNLKTLQQKIDRASLPQTFQDAIDITKRLGISLLWVDSLCILQDDEEDWAREAASMSKVYANTYLNISATAAENGHQGCYRSRDPMKVVGLPVAQRQPDSAHRPSVQVNPDGTSWARIVRADLWTTNVDRAPLNQRGWVLQERLLSKRVLHFSVDQVLWECRENYACETLPDSIPQWMLGEGRFSKIYLRDFVPRKHAAEYGEKADSMQTELWSQIIETYSRAQLTFQHDKLVALSGIAREIAYLLGSTYAAGLWECHLPYCLLWTVEYGGHRSTEYLAPSWSWASINGPIRFPLMMPGKREILMILDTNREHPADSDHLGINLVTPTHPFGRVKSGWLRTRSKVGMVSWGWKGHAKLSTIDTPIFVANHVPPLETVAEANNLDIFYLEPDSPSFISNFHTSVFICLDEARSVSHRQAFFLPIYKQATQYGGLTIGSVEGLLLEQLPTGQFARIGTLRFCDDRTEEIIASFEKREIVII